MNPHTIHLFIVFARIVLVFAAFLREWLSPDLVGAPTVCNDCRLTAITQGR